MPGRRPRTGARSLSKYLRTQALDGRSWIAQQRKQLLADIAADSGGPAAMTARERLTAEVAADAILICRAIINHAFGTGLLDGAGGLTPAVAKGLATYQGVATRALAALGLTPDKVDRLSTTCGACGQTFSGDPAGYLRHACRARALPAAPAAASDSPIDDGAAT